jgi:hypothetical protein
MWARECGKLFAPQVPSGGVARHQGLACYLGTLCCGYDFDMSLLYITDAKLYGRGCVTTDASIT